MNTLNQLGLKYGTDKASNHHNYLDIYARHLDRFKDRRFVLVDAIGGYQYRDRGGESLRMWSDYFPMATIVGIDLYEKMLDQIKANVHLYKCDQNSESGLKKIFEIEGAPTVFIDDFSHINGPTIETFRIVFPMLKSGGIYIVEDIEGSWYKDHGYGGTINHHDMEAKTIINYFRWMLNALNRKFIPHHDMETWTDEIESMHFYTNTIIIHKK